MNSLCITIIVPTNIIPMPLKRSNTILNLSDPNIILEPHKHRPTECLLENRDPLIYKKARYTSDQKNQPSTLLPTHPMHTMPDPGQAIDHAESNNSRTSDETHVIVIEDSDEANSD
jgi:hypothetical protein